MTGHCARARTCFNFQDCKLDRTCSSGAEPFLASLHQSNPNFTCGDHLAVMSNIYIRKVTPQFRFSIVYSQDILYEILIRCSSTVMNQKKKVAFKSISVILSSPHCNREPDSESWEKRGMFMGAFICRFSCQYRLQPAPIKPIKSVS